MNDAARDEADKGRVAFLADVHLKPRDRRGADSFLAVLRRLYASCAHIYILGDLFEFWIGPAHVEYDDYRYVLGELDEVLDGTTPVTMLHGNRDFFLGCSFPVGANIALRADPFTISLGGKPVYLCHGDQLLSRDKIYRFVRGVFYNRWVCALNAILPGEISYYYSNGLRKHSERAVRRKMKRNHRILDITTDALTKIFESGAGAIITGHIHHEGVRFFAPGPAEEPWIEVPEPADARGVLYSLGPWTDRPSVLCWSDGAFAFEGQAGREGE